MDVTTCWYWFDNIFLPEVRKHTRRPVILLMDNAPGNFKTFKRENVRDYFLNKYY